LIAVDIKPPLLAAGNPENIEPSAKKRNAKLSSILLGPYDQIHGVQKVLPSALLFGHGLAAFTGDVVVFSLLAVWQRLPFSHHQVRPFQPVKSRIQGALFELKVPLAPAFQFLDDLIAVHRLPADQTQQKRIDAALDQIVSLDH
jgi:hypothetical protein